MRVVTRCLLAALTCPGIDPGKYMAEEHHSSELVLDERLLRAFVSGKLAAEMDVKVASLIAARPQLLEQLAALPDDGFLQLARNAQQRSHTILNDKNAKLNPPALADNAKTKESTATNRSATSSSQLGNYPGYELTKELGRGGMGVVYLAKNLQLDRLEVLKVLNERLLDHAGAKERFLREIRAVSKLNHPHIVTSYSILPLTDRLVFAMEYVHGMDLHKFIHKHGQLSIPLACSFAVQLATGLQHAHEKGLVHRDIKPSNAIIYKADGQLRLKILDFGLAKATSEEAVAVVGLTKEGTMLGTPEYMSPEQTLDAAKADIRADIYSLGCTLYHMLTGKPPFTGTHGAILLAHAQKEALSLTLVRPELPANLAAIVAKMIAKDADQRFQAPAEVASALKPFIHPAVQPRTARTNGSVANERSTKHELRDADVSTSAADARSALSLDVVSAVVEPVAARDLATEPSQHSQVEQRPVANTEFARPHREPKRTHWMLATSMMLAILVLLITFWQLKTSGLRAKVAGLSSQPAASVEATTGSMPIAATDLSGTNDALNNSDSDRNTTDILDLLRTNSNLLASGWELDDDALHTPMGAWARMGIPVTPADDYAIEMTVARRGGEKGSLAIGLVMQGRQFCVHVDARPKWYQSGEVAITGIDMYAGQTSGANRTTDEVQVFNGQQEHEVRCTVSPDNRVALYCDGECVWERTIDQPHLLSQRPEWKVGRYDRLYLGANGSWTIRKWQITEPSGTVTE